MNSAIGDIFLVYYCPRCDGPHAHHVGPLDADLVCPGVALALAWVYERAVGATEVHLLVTLLAGKRPYALAIERRPDALIGRLVAVPLATLATIAPIEAHILARIDGDTLPPHDTDEAGVAALVALAIERANTEHATLARLLEGLDI